jgi:hypothetical protein
MEKRFANNWSLMGSYTYSESTGLIPRPWFQSQNNPFYGSTDGQDPNAYRNADQLLQGDRPHMFRLQGVFRLPWDFIVSPSLDIQSGKPFPRQIRVNSLNQPSPYNILEPAGSRDGLRLDSQELVNINVGKRFYIGGTEIKIDGIIYNLLNDDAPLFLATTRLQTPGDEFTPDEWILPRRLMVKLGISF